MPALTTPGGAPLAASGGTASWPNWQRQAVTWTRRDGLQFTPPRNPTDSDDTAPTFVTSRQTQDGFLTYVWGANPELAPLTYFTLEEGIGPWKDFRDQFKGRQVTYFNALDNVLMSVTITDVRWVGSGQNPASYKVYVTQQEAEAFK